MNFFSKALVGAAFAATAALASAPAMASTLMNFAQYQQLPATDTVRWTQSAAKTGGTLTDIGDPTVIFRIWDTVVSPGETITVNAAFDLNATVDDGNPATFFMGKHYQQGLHGTFSFKSLSAFSRDGVNYAAGTNLLSATFTNGSIFGGVTGSIDGDTLSGAVVNFSSDVIDTSQFFMDTFTLSLNAVHRTGGSGLTHTVGQSLKNFTSTTTGQFAAAVPEPATWAMMIAGFFGTGVMVRSRRRVAVTA